MTAEEYVAQVVAAAPPLSTEQRNRLAELLRPVRVNQTTAVEVGAVA